jgi:hypothetical protein
MFVIFPLVKIQSAMFPPLEGRKIQWESIVLRKLSRKHISHVGEMIPTGLLEDGVKPLPNYGIEKRMFSPPNENVGNMVVRTPPNMLKLGKIGGILVLKGKIPKETLLEL